MAALRTSEPVSEPVSGYTHLAAMAVGLVGAVFLLARAHGKQSFIPALAYALSLVALFGASSAYHLVPRTAKGKARLRVLDHSAIFLLIAGTCTPVFVRALAGATLAWMLAGIWSLAVLGIALRVAWMGAPRLLYTVMYLAMGWSVVTQLGAVSAALSTTALALVVSGGLVYTLGAIVYASKRPDPFPSVFGFHEIWHLFVIGGSALHYAAVFVLS